MIVHVLVIHLNKGIQMYEDDVYLDSNIVAGLLHVNVGRDLNVEATELLLHLLRVDLNKEGDYDMICDLHVIRRDMLLVLK